jgi:hypothetical protein
LLIRRYLLIDAHGLGPSAEDHNKKERGHCGRETTLRVADLDWVVDKILA